MCNRECLISYNMLLTYFILAHCCLQEYVMVTVTANHSNVCMLKTVFVAVTLLFDIYSGPSVLRSPWELAAVAPLARQPY